MHIETIRQCLTHDLKVHWSNHGYTVREEFGRLWVDWLTPADRGYNSIGLEGNHGDLEKFFPCAHQVKLVIDLEGTPLTSDALPRPGRYVKIEDLGWIAVVDLFVDRRPCPEVATELAIDAAELAGLDASNVLVVI